MFTYYKYFCFRFFLVFKTFLLICCKQFLSAESRQFCLLHLFFFFDSVCLQTKKDSKLRMILGETLNSFRTKNVSFANKGFFAHSHEVAYQARLCVCVCVHTLLFVCVRVAVYVFFIVCIHKIYLYLVFPSNDNERVCRVILSSNK